MAVYCDSGIAPAIIIASMKDFEKNKSKNNWAEIWSKLFYEKKKIAFWITR